MYIPVSLGAILLIGLALYFVGFGVSSRTVPVPVPVRRD